MIAPTFGMGNWDKPGGGELAIDVAREAIAMLPVEAEKIFLMGYSNGAMGVTRAGIKEPALFRGLIYLSAITEDASCATDQLPMRSGRPILFLHGDQDQRIPCGLVEMAAATLKRRGADVRIKVYPGEDHFLIFSQPEAVLGEIRALMSAE